jgi:hypothetical protein
MPILNNSKTLTNLNSRFYGRCLFEDRKEAVLF